MHLRALDVQHARRGALRLEMHHSRCRRALDVQDARRGALRLEMHLWALDARIWRAYGQRLRALDARNGALDMHLRALDARGGAIQALDARTVCLLQALTACADWHTLAVPLIC